MNLIGGRPSLVLDVLLFHGTNATRGALVSRKVSHDFIKQRVLQVLHL